MGLSKDIEIKEEFRKWKRNLDIYPGSLDDYNRLKGVKHEQIDSGSCIKFVYLDVGEEKDVLERLRKEGCTGFIWYSLFNRGSYGVPVKPKMDG